jgi:hypothetical protein
MLIPDHCLIDGKELADKAAKLTDSFNNCLLLSIFSGTPKEVLPKKHMTCGKING